MTLTTKFVTCVRSSRPAELETVQLAGLTDCFGACTHNLPRCDCGCAARIYSSLCVGCLLRSGLANNKASADSAEILRCVLAEVDVPDRNWQFGNYQILEEIGRGGMGVIYRARQRYSRRIVAIKRLLSYHRDSTQTLLRFQREAESVASLDHPNILPIYEIGLDDNDLPFFSMKFAPGGSLLQAASVFRNQPSRIVALVSKIARAVHHAHQNGILHRDLKPGNILLDCSGNPLVADFGLARWLGTRGDLTRTITVFGTPGYIAPEQVWLPTEGLTPAVDIYSLGAILFELLAGRPPFLGEHALAVINQATEKQAPKLRSVNGKISRDLEIICARCLERVPSARYLSADEVADDLERWLAGRPIIARRASVSRQLWSWSRRNRALAVSILACLVLGITATTWKLRSRHFEVAVNSEIALAHSVAVLPIFNLDTIQPDSDLSEHITNAISTEMSLLGTSKVIRIPKPFAGWTGTGNYDEVRLAAQQTGCRSVLAGSVRRTGDKVRLSLHLFAENGNDCLGSWVLVVDSQSTLEGALATSGISRLALNALGEAKRVSPEAQVDPVTRNETARGYFLSGRALLERRTIQDLDRAIDCFQGALRAEPNSITARTYLALAYMGRNFLSANPNYMDQAFSVSREALKLAPDNSDPHRALCALYIATGQLDEALEHGFQALECGDRSERALGQIGFIWKERGHPEKAVQWFSKAKVSERQPADYEGFLGDCWMLLSQDGKARDAYVACQDFHPDLPDGWLGLCHLQLLNQKFDDALALFNQRSSEYTPFHTPKPLHAQIEFFRRNFAEAERLYSEILRSDPLGAGSQQYGAVSSTSALARLRLEAGDRKAAAKFLEQSRKIDRAQLKVAPRNPEVLYRLAADDAIDQNKPGALTYLQAAISAGWIDYRSAQLDPRFDSISNSGEFKKILSELAASVALLSQQIPGPQDLTRLNQNP